MLSQQENVVQSEKAKKMRELKKFGKKVSGTCAAMYGQSRT